MDEIHTNCANIDTIYLPPHGTVMEHEEKSPAALRGCSCVLPSVDFREPFLRK